MALYQPTQIVPSTLSGLGDGVIDATEDLVVSWQINGFSAMTDYQIVIYQNDPLSTQMYDTGKVTLVDPVYGTDQNGDQILFEATPITAVDLATAGIVNGYANGYKLIITQWWSASEYIAQTSASVFITRDRPTIVMDAIASPLASKELSVGATYSQLQGDSISWVQWVLEDSNGNVLKDTGRVSTGVLQFDYDGLFTGSSYTIECGIETENGVTATTGPVSFSVSYPTSQSEGLVEVCRRAGQPFVEVSWTDRSAINGEGTGAYSVAGGQLRLPAGSYVTWDESGGEPVVFAAPWSMAWRGKIPNPTAGGFNPVELTLENSHTFVVNVTDSAVSVLFDSTTIMTQALSVKINDTLVLAVTPTKWYLKQITYTGGLLPATDQYPGTTLYPASTYQQINTWEGTVSYSQDNVTALTLNGAQTCEYLWLYRGELPANIAYYLIGGEWYEPSYDSTTLFLATFMSNDLSADVSGGSGDIVYGMTVYRRESDNEVLLKIADVEPGYTLFRDFGCKSNTPYTYYLYTRGQDTYVAAPFISDVVKPGYNFYTLMEASVDASDPHQYHVIQSFIVSGNLNSGALSNGNNPNILENFTRYPLRQSAPQNYHSGVLTTLIGAVDYIKNSYSDTWGLAERIQALSLSQNTLFLKDMKGAMWMIHTNGPISMSVDDKSFAQPIQMSFPWIEIGSTEGLAIVSLPTDSTWPKDGIIDTSVYLDENTGILSWTYPNDYHGTELLLSARGNLNAQGVGDIDMADISIDSAKNLIVTE